jgi:hypothetical protein
MDCSIASIVASGTSLTFQQEINCANYRIENGDFAPFHDYHDYSTSDSIMFSYWLAPMILYGMRILMTCFDIFTKHDGGVNSTRSLLILISTATVLIVQITFLGINMNYSSGNGYSVNYFINTLGNAVLTGYTLVGAVLMLEIVSILTWSFKILSFHKTHFRDDISRYHYVLIMFIIVMTRPPEWDTFLTLMFIFLSVTITPMYRNIMSNWLQWQTNIDSNIKLFSMHIHTCFIHITEQTLLLFAGISDSIWSTESDVHALFVTDGLKPVVRIYYVVLVFFCVELFLWGIFVLNVCIGKFNPMVNYSKVPVSNGNNNNTTIDLELTELGKKYDTDSEDGDADELFLDDIEDQNNVAPNPNMNRVLYGF